MENNFYLCGRSIECSTKGADGQNSSIVDKAAIRRGDKSTVWGESCTIPENFKIQLKFGMLDVSCKVGTEVRCRRIL